MLNQIVLVGNLVNRPELRRTGNGSTITNITLAVDRSFKNLRGETDTDYLDIVLWKGIAENTVRYCTKGDLILVKGRVQSSKHKTPEGFTYSSSEIVAEKVTFLNTKGRFEE